MDKIVKLSVDSSEAGKFQSEFRREAELLARDMIRSSRQYSTSSKEVLKDIEEQIRAIEKRNKLDAEFKRIRLESLRDRGDVSGAAYTQQRGALITEHRQDELQTRLLRELIDTVVRTSKDEIREDRMTVEKVVRESKTAGRLGVVGDEFESLKETVQAGAISQAGMREMSQRAGLNMSRYANVAMGVGGGIASGDIGGLAMMGSRGMMGAMGGVGLGGGLALAGGASILGVIAAMFASNKQLPEQMRSYMLSTQTGVGGMRGNIDTFGSQNFYKMGMSPVEGMDFYSNILRSSGGRSMDLDKVRGLAGLTRSRDVSPELLNGVISSQRYSTSGDVMSIATVLERTLEKIYPKEFKDKLVQLPEMMNVYNSLAQQMIQTTGYINSTQLSGFVGGVREGFGVEGVNLQRFAGGLMGGMKGSQNPYLRKFQFAALRKAHPDYDYQQYLETLENPTSDVEYMRNYAGMMKGQGLRQFSSWFGQMGLGAKEARQAFESNDFSKMFEAMGTVNKDKTSPVEDYTKYFDQAQQFYGASEKQTQELLGVIKKIEGFLGQSWENIFSKGMQDTITKNGGSLPVKDTSKFR